MSWELRQGDCLEVLSTLKPDSIDAIVADPPYGIGFMGHGWDRPTIEAGVDARDKLGSEHWKRKGRSKSRSQSAFSNGAGQAGSHDFSRSANHEFQEWCRAWSSELLRVLKPGGHLLAFGGTRTYHRLTAGIEDAGFEIRDCLAWLFGSGFPKSHNVGKALADDRGHAGDFRHREAAAWAGHGTALKPAFEPIVLARKPLAGTVATSALEHGTGPLNIDGCRVEFEEGGTVASNPSKRESISGGNGGHVFPTEDERRDVVPHAGGRWPANVILDAEAGHQLDIEAGEGKSGVAVKRNLPEEGASQSIDFKLPTARGDDVGYGDEGGPSRFFYCAKASTAERNAGLADLSTKEGRNAYGTGLDGPRPHTSSDYEFKPKERANVHPTVKPIDLMRWCVRLVTPPSGTVLDPFNGSGTTGIAAVLEGFNYLGIERETEYIDIASARIAWWEPHAGEDTADVLARAGLSEKEKRRLEEMGQLGLLEEAA